MTRQDIELKYQIQAGIIWTPGKFHSEPMWAPYYFAKLQQQPSDGIEEYEERTDDICDVFIVTPRDKEQFPELEKATSVRLYITEQGTVVTDTIERD